MPLSKWSSNSKLMTDKFDHELGNQDSGSIKILGMRWLSSQDCFTFDGLDLGSDQVLTLTKRTVLSLIARLFDPLGLLCPFTILAKSLFQEMWRRGLSWDDELPEDLGDPFFKWVQGIRLLKQWEIPRCYTSCLPWSSLTNLEVHAFGDASEIGYGACVYLRIPSVKGIYQTSLVVAKAKVAPLKRVSLPRLELLAALLCARLVVFVKSALRLSDSVTYRCWTDARVTLAWIKGDPYKWKTFVANRVSEIHQLTSPQYWFHCPGKENPADLLTRGIFAEQLISSDLWLKGPRWLYDASSSFPPDYVDQPLIIECSEEQAESVNCLSVDPMSEVFEFSRWSSFTKSVHVIAWVLRFIKNTLPMSVRSLGAFSSDELAFAERKLFSCVQSAAYSEELLRLRTGKPIPKGSPIRKLDPFLDSDGLLRVKGRLQFSNLDYESRHPVILPQCHVSKLLVRFQHVFLKHAGVSTLVSTLRGSYWIVGVRRLAKTVCD
ncbi:PREDICTED: uncharacterized protein LOC106815855 [Priapulus caudatus]|uniref:Uncharacterized protein LOC106815855 n=1 Tax=Priapulus caudatus TaxID=37621 RepID=A0ABM1EUJ5_PRICU|nr:PREDICTED: uncharacterized protein LOC106815855 [Priapulus caudatus]